MSIATESRVEAKASEELSGVQGTMQGDNGMFVKEPELSCPLLHGIMQRFATALL